MLAFTATIVSQKTRRLVDYPRSKQVLLCSVLNVPVSKKRKHYHSFSSLFHHDQDWCSGRQIALVKCVCSNWVGQHAKSLKMVFFWMILYWMRANSHRTSISPFPMELKYFLNSLGSTEDFAGKVRYFIKVSHLHSRALVTKSQC